MSRRPSPRAEPDLTHWLFGDEPDANEKGAEGNVLVADGPPPDEGPPPGEGASAGDGPRDGRLSPGDDLAPDDAPRVDGRKHAPRHRRTAQRRRPSRPVLMAGVALALAGGVLASRTVLADPPARLTVETTGPGPAPSEVLVVGAGATDLAGLTQQARLLGRGDALRQVGPETYLLSMPLTLGPGAHLTLASSELRLRSDAGSVVGLEARGGDLTLRNATVTSWDPATDGPDTNVADGRAYILARDGGRLDVVDSSASMLGYDAFERYGVSWRTEGTDGVIDGSTFTGNFYGAYMNGVEPMEITDSVIQDSVSYGLDPHSGSRDFTITGNTFRNNGKHGMILAEDCTGAVVRDNESYGNAEHGIVVFGGSDDVVVEGNRVHNNGLAGISVNGAARAALRDNDVWANTTGITVQDEATESLIENNRVSGNREDGVLITSDRATATIVANRLDHNGRAGVWVNGGQATVGPDNHIANNASGVRLVDETPSVRVFDNLLIENYKDGFSLVVSEGLTISGNRIVDSDAAFSVRTAGMADPFLDGNSMEDNRLGPERVREPDPAAEPEPGTA